MAFLLEIRPNGLFLRHQWRRQSAPAAERGRNRVDFAPRRAFEQGQPLRPTSYRSSGPAVKGIAAPLAGN
jgi:hypothetical protein